MRRLILPVALLPLFACATAPMLRAPPDPGAARRAEAATLAERWIAAETPEALLEATRAAEEAAPGSALAAELHGLLAWLQADEEAQFDAWERALLDPSDDDPALHLAQLEDVPFSFAQFTRARALVDALSAAHPDASVRYVAAHLGAGYAALAGDDAAAAELYGRRGEALAFAVVGPWDNDQGKGFELPLPPEQGLAADGRWDGVLRPIGWRTDVVPEPGGALVLDAALAPEQHGVAFAAAAIASPVAQQAELRLSTSDAVKVWVNGALVFQAARLDAPAELPDALVLPIRLRAGTNRLLVKSAQREGPWRLFARLSAPGGAALPGLQARPFAEAMATGEASAPSTEAEVLARRVASLPEGSLRRRLHEVLWAQRLGLRRTAGLPAAEALLAAAPRSIVARWLLARELEALGERGRAGDLVTALDAEAGEQLARLRLHRARSLAEQKLREGALDLLRALVKQRGAHAGALIALARHYAEDGQPEERRALLERAAAVRDGPGVRLALADALGDQGFRAAALSHVRRILEVMPRHPEALARAAEAASNARDEVTTAELLMTRTTQLPHRPEAWLKLGEALRRGGDVQGAFAAFERARTVGPDDAAVFRAIGRLRLQQGDEAGAAAAWDEALERDPRDDALAHRLETLRPREEGAFARERPSLAALDELVASRDRRKPAPGADLVVLLDHGVTRLQPDGTRAEILTQVFHSVNAAGRDRLTRLSMEGPGRTRLLAAWAVDPEGRRTEATSVRGRLVHFRGLRTGSTVVLQYRRDVPPQGFLSRHLTQLWWFEQAAAETRRSEWILFAPEGTTLHETTPAGVARTERNVEGERRIAWVADELAPQLPEPGMPGPRERLRHLLVSSVPSWEAYAAWERALLEGVFRESPEVGETAARVLAGADSAEEKIARIQRFLVEEIRYQQDYEDTIAGVKPHAAAEVLERRYGDCKDKAVLFIALARRAGLQAHFALVRTRPAGPVEREVPMQQFDHAIVWVPAQPGLPTGRFHDPTADGLDVGVLRADVPGSASLVFDPDGGAPSWIEIPFDPAAASLTRFDLSFALDAEGAVLAEGTLRAHGVDAASLRRGARNPERFQQAFRAIVGETWGGATLTSLTPVQVTDLRRPVEVAMTFRTTSLARREGDAVRLRVPSTWSPRAAFQLPTRTTPLLLGAPSREELVTTITLPPGATPTRLPDGRVESACLVLERRATLEAGRVIVTQSLERRCERVAPPAYGSHREAVEAMLRLLEDEVVFTLPPTKPPPRGR